MGLFTTFCKKVRFSPEFERKLRFARDIAEGMRFLHSKGRIHRDLKSPNLLVSWNWVVKVAGFGSARALSNLGASSETVDLDIDADSHDGNDITVPLLRYECRAMSRRVGTLLYNAPEVLSRQAYGAAIDVYR